MTHSLRTPRADTRGAIAPERPETGASEEAVRLALRLRGTPAVAGSRALLFLPVTPGGDASRVAEDAVCGVLELQDGPVLVMDLRTRNGRPRRAAEALSDTDDACLRWNAPPRDGFVRVEPFAGRADAVSYAASAEFTSAIELARRTYPFVICVGDCLDTSVETLIAAGVCDGAILTVAPGRTTRSAVQRAAEQLRRGGAHVAGFVVEGRTPEGEEG